MTKFDEKHNAVFAIHRIDARGPIEGGTGERISLDCRTDGIEVGIKQSIDTAILLPPFILGQHDTHTTRTASTSETKGVYENVSLSTTQVFFFNRTRASASHLFLRLFS
jgi:hypothetical protein